jgi:hypothetical protein
MNQGTVIAAAIQNVMPAARATGLFVSLFTAAEPVPTIGGTGAVLFDYTPVAGLIAIPCTAPPENTGSIVATEVRGLEEIVASELHHVLLNAYLPQLDAGWRGENSDGKGAWIAQIAPIASQPDVFFSYEISGSESDSQSQMTRVRVKLATL